MEWIFNFVSKQFRLQLQSMSIVNAIYLFSWESMPLSDHYSTLFRIIGSTLHKLQSHGLLKGPINSVLKTLCDRPFKSHYSLTVRAPVQCRSMYVWSSFEKKNRNREMGDNLQIIITPRA